MKKKTFSLPLITYFIIKFINDNLTFETNVAQLLKKWQPETQCTYKSSKLYVV